MCNFIKYVVLFILSTPLSLLGQHNGTLDSIAQNISSLSNAEKANAYNKAFKTYLYKDITLVKSLADSMSFYAEKSGDENLKARAINNQASHFFLIKDIQNALKFYNLSIDKYQEIGNEKEVAGVLINVANCYGELGDLEQSMKMHLRSLRIQEKLGITGYSLANNYFNIGILHTDLKDPAESLKWQRKARNIYVELDDEFSVMEVDYSIALNLFDIDSVDQAQKILDRLEVYFRKNKNVYLLTDVLLESGKNFHLAGDLHKAETYFQEALSLAKESEDESVFGILYNKLYGLYLSKGELNKAKSYAISSYENSLRFDKKRDQVVDLENLASISEEMGEYQQSISYHKKYKLLHDSILGQEKIKAIKELETKYETEKKEQEILLLEEKAKRNNIERNALIGGILCLGIILFTFIYAMRLRLQKAKIAKAKVDQELTFSNKELDFKKQELTAYALQIAHKNEVLEGIKINVSNIKEDNSRALQQIVNTINFNQNDDNTWDGFRAKFQSIHKDFESNLKKNYPDVSSNELRLMSLIKMNLSNKEIANILNISNDGIKKARYRLRKKLGLQTSDSLEELVLSF